MACRARAISETEGDAATGRKSSKLSQENDATSARHKLEPIYVIIPQLKALAGDSETSQQHVRPASAYDCFLSISKASNTFSANTRPLRSNCGKGGAVAQLQAVAKSICADTTRKKITTNILKDVPLNAMALPEKGVHKYFLTIYSYLML